MSLGFLAPLFSLPSVHSSSLLLRRHHHPLTHFLCTVSQFPSLLPLGFFRLSVLFFFLFFLFYLTPSLNHTHFPAVCSLLSNPILPQSHPHCSHLHPLWTLRKVRLLSLNRLDQSSGFFPSVFFFHHFFVSVPKTPHPTIPRSHIPHLIPHPLSHPSSTLISLLPSPFSSTFPHRSVHHKQTCNQPPTTTDEIKGIDLLPNER